MFRLLAVICGCLVVASIGCSDDSARTSSEIDFHRDVRPILVARCIGCHGPSQQLGGLRFDDRTFALSGGVSGKRLDQKPAEENELLRRIVSSDPAVRMPKEGGSLDESSVGLLRRWVEAGTPWPDSEKPSGWYEFRSRYASDLWKRFSVVGGEIKVFLLMGFAILIAIGDRIRRKPIKGGSDWSEGWRNWIWRVSQHVSTSAFLAGILVVVVWDLAEFSIRQSASVAETELRLRELANIHNGIRTHQPGKELMPLKPRSPVPFGGTYYRGNDERSSKLFNGGFYRTATMTLSLVDETGRTVQRGEGLSGSELSVRLEIQRASQATPSLFTDAMLKEVLLSRRTPDRKESFPADEPARMSVIESGERWSAIYRLGEFQNEPMAAHNGVIYVYSSGQIQAEAVTGSIQYGIVYALRLQDRKLQHNSELWMGPVLLPSNFQPTDPSKITLSEWLDTNPIPEVTGENSSDPELLGIPEPRN